MIGQVLTAWVSRKPPSYPPWGMIGQVLTAWDSRKPPSCPPWGMIGQVLTAWVSRKPPSYPPWGMIVQVLATWVSSWLSVTKEKPLQGGVGEGFLHLFNIYSQLFGYYSPKNIFCKRSSTLPPHRCYILNNQYVIHGGIMGGIRVELHEVPP